MNFDSFRRALNRLGLPQAGAARLFGCNERTVRRWASGDERVPRIVEIVLWLMQKFGVKPEDIPPAADEDAKGRAEEEAFHQRIDKGPIQFTRPKR